MDKDSLQFHTMIEKEVVDLNYGQITINVILKNGLPLIKTLNIVKSKRKKYTVLTSKQ